MSYNGKNYQSNSTIQQIQANRLLQLLTTNLPDFHPQNILELGCGTGNLTRALAKAYPRANILATDMEESQIKTAHEQKHSKNVTYKTIDAISVLQDSEEHTYDLIISSSALHWLPEEKQAYLYKLVRKCLSSDGIFANQQGAANCYKELHTIVCQSILEKNLASKYAGWVFPVYYPTKEEYFSMLSSDFSCLYLSEETTYLQLDQKLIQAFLNASFLYYKLPSLSLQEYKELTSLFLQKASNHLDADITSNRILVLAKPRYRQDIPILVEPFDKTKIYPDFLYNLLQESDKEFVPPLSQRQTTQDTILSPMNLKTSTNSVQSYLNSLLKQNNLIAYVNSQPVGFLSYTYKDNKVYISTILVQKRFRKQKVATNLYAFLEQSLPKGTLIETRTWSRNTGNLHTLISRGYSPNRIISSDRGKNIDTIYFQKVV